MHHIYINAIIIFQMDDGTVIHWICNEVMVDPFVNNSPRIETGPELSEYLGTHGIQKTALMTVRGYPASLS
ncbi:hypothetical protein DF200_04430 [Bifidobacterium catulorum]|uniref:Uncharacterized protein n=1 Tax=Bifidobacterium catulorum TaxID=1630173 RepID=A0A2U2MT37_9BIFI|nr:hypothetical protein DF200_04430 [Bifidobacterium catulorum]